MAKKAKAKASKGIVLSEDQQRRQRARNVAIGVLLAGLVVLFYLITVFKLGANVANRSI
jgi:hypothetical protein